MLYPRCNRGATPVKLGKNNAKFWGLIGNSTERNALCEHNRHYKIAPGRAYKEGVIIAIPRKYSQNLNISSSASSNPSACSGGINPSRIFNLDDAQAEHNTMKIGEPK